MGELQEALVIEPGMQSLDSADFTDPSDIVHSCGGLVDHDKHTEFVTFSHELVRKYVDTHKDDILFGPSVIASSILNYLLLPMFENPDRWRIVSKSGLSEYAREFWAMHVKQTEQERSADVEVCVFERFGSIGRAKVIIRPHSWDWEKEIYFIHILVDGGIDFILTEPSSDHRILHWYAFLSNLLTLRLPRIFSPPNYDTVLGIDITSTKGYTWLQRAAFVGDLDKVQWLVAHGADAYGGCNAPAWLLASRIGHHEVAKFLIKDNIPRIDKLTPTSWVTLYGASRYGLETGISHAERLLQINTTDFLGKTAFQLAFDFDELPFAKWLVELYKADVNEGWYFGIRLLDFYQNSISGEFLEWIVLKTNVIVSSRRQYDPKKSLLHRAASCRRRKLMEYLVKEVGLDLTTEDSHECTVLNAYVMGNEEESTIENDVLEWLLEGNNEGLNRGDYTGKTPLYSYISYKFAELQIVQNWVDERGGDITFVRPRGGLLAHYTALHYAVWSGNLEIIRWLVEVKAMDVGCLSNMSPVTLRENLEVQNYLESRISKVGENAV